MEERHGRIANFSVNIPSLVAAAGALLVGLSPVLAVPPELEIGGHAGLTGELGNFVRGDAANAPEAEDAPWEPAFDVEFSPALDGPHGAKLATDWSLFGVSGPAPVSLFDARPLEQKTSLGSSWISAPMRLSSADPGGAPGLPADGGSILASPHDLAIYHGRESADWLGGGNSDAAGGMMSSAVLILALFLLLLSQLRGFEKRRRRRTTTRRRHH